MILCQFRLLRVAVFATACVALAALGHAAVSGQPVAVPVLGAAAAGTAAGTWLLAGRRRGIAAITGWMTAAQAALHLLFEQTAARPAAPAPSADLLRLLLCVHGETPAGVDPVELARAAGLDPAVLGTAAGHAHGLHGGGGGGTALLHGMSPGMAAAHLAAALACSLLLWRGEAALAAVVAALRTLAEVFAPLVLVLAPFRHEPPRTVRPAVRRVRRPRQPALAYAVGRRGPPHPAPAV
ncbi:hypothetical protein [Streptomyces sp. NRRL B-24484]|uniref:hypothetical protein n=1 Tax=Streptomyces sp. NRRL B-24484 TaxID=1463833 RepID=UPI000694FA28|nr:hypothetical protein [Streptomyces sp. NRRL B-24484]